jgi:exopolyphosphatase/guanosine-5'-triphosphate,3'-diphosphate pyrophosphatase
MRIAAIDIGTNSVHMIVCRIRPDLSFEVVDREKDMIRLGAGSLDGGALSVPVIATAMQTLSKFRRLADSHGVDEVIASATSAVREAENGGDFVAAVHRDLGIRVRVISGTEEARLIHQAAAYATGVGARPAVVVDVGGGSTEITLGTARRMALGRSFKLGVIRLTERFVKSDPLSGRDERRLVKHIRKEVRGFVKQVVKRGFQRVIGTSGTMLALGPLAMGARHVPDEVRNLRIEARQFRRLRKRLTGLTLDERVKLPGLDPRRADLAVAGAVLIDTLLSELGADDVALCDFALREGLVLDYIQRNRAHIHTVDRYPDVRRRSVIELGERCRFYPAHAHQVAKLALTLFDATKSDHRLGDREREWLEYAALLHDIGAHISYERHHKHSHYLIANGGLRGFERDEIGIIALVARYHRQATPRKTHTGFSALDRQGRRIVRVLAALLRLAEGLDRSHAQVIDGLRVREDHGDLVVRVSSAGDTELELWAAERHARPLITEIDRPIRFELTPAAGRAGRRALAAQVPHAQHPQHAAHLPRPSVRRRGHRRLRKDDAARPPRKMARRQRAQGVRH